MTRLFKSFSYASNGIKLATKGRNFKLQSAVACLVSVAGVFFKITTLEWVAILICFVLVLSLEIVNSAIEQLADVVRDELKLNYSATKKTRDLAAGAVLFASAMSALVGLEIFLPRLF